MSQTIVTNHTPPTKRAKKIRAPKVLAMAVVLIVVFAAGFFASIGLTSLSQKNAKQTVHSFIAALNKGENTKAYGYTSGSFRQQQPQEQFNITVGNLKASKPSYSYEAISFNGFNGTVASYSSVEAGLPPNEGGNTTRTIAVTLVKNGPIGWKIDTVNIF